MPIYYLRRNQLNLKYIGSFTELKELLSSIDGKWEEKIDVVNGNDKKIFRYKKALMNWYYKTGTIDFQGKQPNREYLESFVSEKLNVKIHSKIESTDDKLTSDIIRDEYPDLPKVKSLERKFLDDGINEGDLIIGIVSAVGTEYNKVTEALKNNLKGFGYDVNEIRVSEYLPNFLGDKNDEYARISHYMKEGDNLRRLTGNNAILAAGAATQISRRREMNSDKHEKYAYIINSLKNPKEVDFLRKIYGSGFYLIGIHANIERRLKFLTRDKSMDQDKANELIRIDEDESVNYGQKTRDTYHLADFFLNVGGNTDSVKNHLQRFLELIFSHPYRNPTFDEFAMFMAFNSSVRSGDLSRQVGAVISRDKQIIATGANDVPMSGGGLYWAEINEVTGEITDVESGKDFKRKVDSNKKAQAQIIDEIANKIISSDLVEENNKGKITEILKESKISDLTEFGRVVHAEMDALLSCSRAGITTTGSTLFCTTFPCHNCAKHIIASGVKRVVYVEPYPKSRALEFHSESIYLKSELEVKSRKHEEMVTFEPFIGVGPRRFLDLFSMSLGSGSKLKRKNKDGSTVEWIKKQAPIRTPLLKKSYLDVEQAAVEMWEERNKGGNHDEK